MGLKISFELTKGERVCGVDRYLFQSPHQPFPMFFGNRDLLAFHFPVKGKC